ncbi:MAG: hypothetical protein LBS36_04275 [Oscillospiraceae bacterium]|jgi:hypothetical protein|nr:hypothetical protein [Oscillospiraceae bacterium]
MKARLIFFAIIGAVAGAYLSISGKGPELLLWQGIGGGIVVGLLLGGPFWGVLKQMLKPPKSW